MGKPLKKNTFLGHELELQTSAEKNAERNSLYSHCGHADWDFYTGTRNGTQNGLTI